MKKKKRKTRWLTSFITLAPESANGGASFNRTADVTPEAMGEVGQQSTGGGSGEQAIVVMDLPEMIFHGQPDVEITHLSDLEEVPPSHEEARGDIPSKQTVSRLS